MSLTTEQLDAYQRDGYLVIENVLDTQTLTRLRNVISEFVEQSKLVSRSDAMFDVGPGHSPGTPELRRLKNPVEHHPEFHALMRSDAILDIVADLLGGTVRFDHSKLNFKPAGGNAKIEWHQDWAFYPHTNDSLLAVGVMVEDCTPENGPLMVIPGSHKGVVYDHHLNGVFAGGIREEALSDQIVNAVSLTAPAGSISFHHVRTLHASSDNCSDMERPLLLFAYSAVDAFPVFASYDLTEYNNRILLGDATFTPRAEHIPMRIPLPRSDKADLIYENQSVLSAKV